MSKSQYNNFQLINQGLLFLQVINETNLRDAVLDVAYAKCNEYNNQKMVKPKFTNPKQQHHQLTFYITFHILKVQNVNNPLLTSQSYNVYFNNFLFLKKYKERFGYHHQI